LVKNTFAPIRPARRGEELLEAIGQQLNTVPPATPPATTSLNQRSATPEIPPQAVRPAPFVLRLSPTVFQEIDARATREAVTMTVIIARALQDAGFSVPEDDLKDRRKRRFRS